MPGPEPPNSTAQTAHGEWEQALAGARARLTAGQAADAERAYLSLAGRNPDSTDAWLGLVEARLAQGALRAAGEAVGRAAALAPGDAAVLAALGRVLQAQGSEEDAAEAYARALAAAPRDPDIATGLASALLASGRGTEAGRLLDDVLAAVPDHPPARLARARLDARAGNLKAALAGLEGLSGPDVGLERAGLLSLLGRAAESRSLALALWQQDGIAAEQRAGAAFLLGSLAEAAGEYPAAFDWYERGNALQFGEFDAAAHAQWIDRLVASAGSVPRGRAGSRGPVFVVGMPRSGTTLVERMLAAHPALFGAGELARIGELSVMMEQRGWSYPESLDSLPAAALAGWARDYLARLERQGARGRVPVDKMWQNFEHLGLVRRLFPDARIVHCRRHPLDVGLSCFANHFSSAGAFAFSQTLPGIAAYHHGYERLMAAWRARLDPPMLELRYESLIADPRRALQALLDFLGLPFEPRCLEFHREPGVVLTASYAQVRRPLYASSVGRWRRFAPQLAPLAASLRTLVADYEAGSRD